MDIIKDIKGNAPLRLRGTTAWIAAGVVALYVASSFLRFTVHPSGAHVRRQSDTIGMSMRFAEEIRERGLAALDFILFPKVLQSGLFDGINAAEFPLLNVLTGPFFLLGPPWLGVFLSAFLVLGINLFAARVFLPRLLRFWNVEVSWLVCVLVWIAIPISADQSVVIMPESLALPLMLMGMTFALEGALGPGFTRGQMKAGAMNWRASALGVVLCGLGVAMKPNAVIVLAALPLAGLVRGYRSRLPALTAFMAASTLFPAYWYRVHLQEVVQSAEGPQVFHPEGLWSDYYLVGAALFVVVIVLKALASSVVSRRANALLVLIVFLGAIYNTQANGRLWAASSDFMRIDLWDHARAARDWIPDSHHLVTDDKRYPGKLLRIARSGTAAGENPLRVCDQSEYRDLPLAVVMSDEPGDVRECGGRPAEVSFVESDSARWFLVLVPPK